MDSYKLTATQALAKFRDGSLTVETYARSLLRHIEERDAVVRAWAYVDPDYVIEQARRLDQVPHDRRGPLHGVAIAVKDIIYTKDMPTQYNSPIYEGDAPKVDAASVITLRHAGALILGKATTTEFSGTLWGVQTYNPHDPTRTPGGSSSGPGAAVGDFQAPIGLGTQTAGSIIRPGSFNGIYAFKPTWGAVSREGQKMYAVLLDTLGFYARCVQDLDLLADIFALADDASPAPFSLKGARFASVKTTAWPEAGPGTIAAMDTAARLLRSYGATVEDVEFPPEFANVPGWQHVLMHAEARASLLPLHQTAKEKLDPYLAGLVENIDQISRAEHLMAVDGLAALRPVIDGIAGRYAAILTPSAPDVAPLRDERNGTGSPSFNKIWTALHVPVINVPGFKGENDLPVGLSLVAPRYRDRHLLAVAKEVGKVFEAKGGWGPNV